jgi:DNA-binding NtrC family response regulator
MPELLIVDDDRAIRRSLELHLQGRGFAVRCAADLAEAESLWRERTPDLVILDLMLPDGEGIDLLDRMTDSGGSAKVIIITGHQDMEKATAAIRAGAFDYVHKPLDVDDLDAVLDRALAERLGESRLAFETDGGAAPLERGKIVGRSRAILELHKAIGRAGRGRANVLIRGESGTGKELVARAIHRNRGAERPFVAVNCSALVPTLLESELFGHEKGAFTGALQRRQGRLEVAGRGTLFLDEIGDLPQDLQAKLLRVLQEREFERVGGNRAIPLEAELIAATHRDLEEKVAAGEFREDLYYRLKVVEIVVPPLRERIEDIPPLVEHFLAIYNAEFHRRVTKVPAEVLRRLETHEWSGTVRELENRVQAGIMASAGDALVVELPVVGGAGGGAAPGWRRSLAEVERDHVLAVLERCAWNLGKTCEVLGISRPTLRKKIADHELKAPDSKA